MRYALATVLLLVMAALDAAPVHACSRILCTETIAPLGNDTQPAHLPVNGVFIGAPPARTGTTISVVIDRGGVEMTRSIEPALVVEIPDVEVGDRVRVSVERECGGTTSTVLDVTAFAPIPTELGTLALATPRRTVIEVRDDRGSCTSDFRVSVAPFSLVLDPSVEPWRDALIETVRVDDASWPPSHDAAVESRFVYGACEEPTSTQRPTPLSLGSHRMRIEAVVRGVAHGLTTTEERFVLGCDIPPGTDAAVMSDGSLTLGASASCAATFAHRGSFGGMAGFGLLLAVVLRRRRLVDRDHARRARRRSREAFDAPRRPSLRVSRYFVRATRVTTDA